MLCILDPPVTHNLSATPSPRATLALGTLADLAVPIFFPLFSHACLARFLIPFGPCSQNPTPTYHAFLAPAGHAIGTLVKGCSF